MRTRLGFASLVVALLLPSTLRAQEQPTALPIGTPLLAEITFAPAIVGGGRWVKPSLSLFLGASWVGFSQEKGYRFGFMISEANIRGPLPADASLGMVRSRSIGAITAERVRLRQRGSLVLTTGFGAGLGRSDYVVDQSRSADTAQYRSIGQWAPAIAASVDVALRMPRSPDGGGTSPFDVFLGLRSTTVLGARLVDDFVPSIGSIPTSRGTGHALQLTIGARFGLFSEAFSSAP